MTNEEAIKVLKANYPDACFGQLREAVDAAIEALTKEAWKEEHPVSPLLQSSKQDADDLISRKQAIDAILAVTGNSSVRELYEHVQEHGLSEMWSGGVNAAIDIIIALPSVQPETPMHIGWICPICGRGLSPLTSVCPCNNGKGWEITC